MEFALGIHAYTLAEPSIYDAVNAILNDTTERNTTASPKVVAALRFTKFIDEALKQLPSYKPPEGQPYVYRGIRYVHRDFKSRFADGTIFPWYTLKSASTGIEVLDTFCGQTGPRTVFEITVKEEDSSVKDISMFSAFPEEKEVLAPPSTMFKVTGQLRRDPEKQRGRPLETADVVKLEEIDGPEKQQSLPVKGWVLCLAGRLQWTFCLCKGQEAVTALELNPTIVGAWHTLGVEGGGSVGGVDYDKKTCYVKALHLDPNYAWSWNNLGVEGGGSVGGVDYDKKTCYVKALELDPNYAMAWNNLGAEGGGSAGDGNYDKKTCYVKALLLDPKYTHAWHNLGNVGGGSVGGVDYNKKTCYVKILESDPKDTTAWIYLGVEGGGSVEGVDYDKKTCYVKALQLDSKNAMA